MQNLLLKGMIMLCGIKKTQPVFQLWMKGIFDNSAVLKEMLHSKADNSQEPLGTQTYRGCKEEHSTKQKANYSALGQICIQPYLAEVSALCRNNVMGRAGWSHPAGMDWDACEMLSSPHP